MFTETIELKRFPGQMGWHYLKLPLEFTEQLKSNRKWQFTKIRAQIGETEWQTSLMPFGDGHLFIAVKKDVRKKEGLEIGDVVEVRFRPEMI